MTMARPDPNVRIFGSPHRYYQGPGALDRLPDLCLEIASHPMLVVDADVLAFVGARLGSLFEGREHTVVPFSGEVTASSMDSMAEFARSQGADIVLGIGGGKALDAGKGTARRAGLRFVSVPTVASNDSPTSTGLAVYDDNHRMVALESLGRNPEAVVVDTQIIAGAPSQFLRAGIGDAIAKKFEGEASQRAGGLNGHYTRQLRTASYIADGCYQTIREFGIAAMAAAGSGTPNEAFEAVIEANILMAGLGFENMGLGIAHGITRGLVRMPGVDRAPHGYHVAYGTLVLLAAEERSDAFIDDILEFYRSIGLPRSLTEMGLATVDRVSIETIATNTTIAPEGAFLIVPVGADALVRAIDRIEARFMNTPKAT